MGDEGTAGIEDVERELSVTIKVFLGVISKFTSKSNDIKVTYKVGYIFSCSGEYHM